VLGPDRRIAPGGEFKRPRGMSRRSEDVFDLSRLCQRVKKRRTGRRERRPRRFTRCRLSRIAGLVCRPLCRPGGVAQRLGPLGPIRERLRRIDRSPRARIVRAFPFEDR
jgi:hypothetical protein